MYQEDPLAGDIGLSERMRQWIEQPYTILSLRADTDDAATTDPSNDADTEGQHNADPDDISLQQSHHLIPATTPTPQPSNDPTPQGEPSAKGEPKSKGEHPPQVSVSAADFTELLTLTRYINQCLRNVEADITQLKAILLPTPPATPPFSPRSPSAGPNDDNSGHDDVQKGGDNLGSGNTVPIPDQPAPEDLPPPQDISGAST